MALGRGAFSALLLGSGIALGALAGWGYAHFAAPDGDDAPHAAPAAPATTTGALVVDDATRRRAGIVTAALATTTQSQGETGYARALDLGPLAAIGAEIDSARAAATASAREAARLAALAGADAGAAQREVESARAQARADAARLNLACQRVTFEFGAGLSHLGCGAAEALARQASRGEVAILRLDFPASAPPAGAMVQIDLAPGSTQVRVLGPAAAGDTQLQSGGALALLTGPQAPRIGVGRILAATTAANGPVRQGVIVPRSAIMRTDAGLFVWRATAADRFERVALEDGRAMAPGWFVPIGRLHGGDQVVIAGAGTLLGLDHAAPQPSADGGDD
ncbi:MULTISPECIES: hypothetical protein [unclassified Novosphingobium]|uniref:hypothetical protein n=1 Tax=unclassified Novosphingobium TaxID=2644732 RepID=UPI000D30939A|nr:MULTISPECIES: hypothetical protein [unclassified Novosphingobium]PTR13336.1 hypothetical protein C8K11_101329 [Novosphingobium sp. GV055]PUB07555.1 hypothetical protein C8K12_101329 [Novosphingobium sp. GV061]PUB23368.1 hypothetical protein C8K14_101329 [Novosphingobium sp. GV079]PUB45132.1 hypothetical protein C8K10_101329 [Novosphingobium sp. GV027]